MKIIDHANQPEVIWRNGVAARMCVSALTGAAKLCIFEQSCMPGTGAPTHWHDAEEVLTVLAGEVEIWVEGSKATVSAGQSVLVPSGHRHGFRNASTAELRLRATLSAPVFEAHYDGQDQIMRRWAEPEG